MNVEPGVRLGPYEILGRIGAGGMGEVWKARDTRLDRLVAVKVLPPEFEKDEQLRIRFEREAKIVSQLEHPNICRLYDVGDGYLVMELLEGESLAERLFRGPLPLREVLKWGVQIADALDRAHRRGVVHRDLKPGNIMLTKSGAKLLDFGLARAIPLVQAQFKTDAVTAHTPLTGEAVIVGTYAYMSPEQVSAQEIDGRSDIFSLGIVLYEMVCGRRAFQGATALDTMHAIAHSEPLLLPPDIAPPGVEQVIHRCMEKDRDDRFQSAGDVAFALSTVLAPSSGSREIAGRKERSHLPAWLWPPAALAVLIVGGIAGVRFFKPAPAADREVTRFQIAFPPDAPLQTGGIAISPDGRTLAYVRRSGGENRLYLRSLAALDDAVVEGSTGAASPFFSPDGKSVAFSADGKLKKLRIADRQIVTIAETGDISSGSWNSDGTIAYSSNRTSTIFTISENGKAGHEITHLDHSRGEMMHSNPQLLPDNRSLLFSSRTGFGTDARGRIESVDLATGARRVILGENAASGTVNAGFPFRWFPRGILLFTAGRRLCAVRFDPRQGKTAGEAIVVIDPMNMNDFAISNGGTLVYYSPGTVNDAPSRIMRTTALGSEQPLPLPVADYRWIALSPDERQLAVTIIHDGRPQVAIADIARGTIAARSAEGAHIPLWTPDGQRVIYSWTGGGPSNLVWQRADGSDDPQPLLSSPNHQDPASFSPDGRWLAYADHDPATNWDIWLMPTSGPRTPHPYLHTHSGEYSPMIAPDGRNMAYVIHAPPQAPQVFIDTFPEPSRRVYVGDGRNPMWSRDGRTLYFSTEDTIAAVDVTVDRTISAPRAVAEGLTFPGVGYGSGAFAPMKDGSLLIIRAATTPRLTVAMNWSDELDNLMKNDRAR